jgi:tRNA dimethylallyltransferase
VGGSYLYLKHLLYGVETENIPPNWQLRNELEKLDIKGLQNRLKILNLNVISQMNESDKSNPRRLIRRLEIEYFKAQKSHSQPDWESNSQIHEDDKKKSEKVNDIVCTGCNFLKNSIFTINRLVGKKLNIKIIGLKFKNKKDLKNAIKKRVEQRLRNGAIQEVKKLLKNGYSDRDPGLQTIGYKQVIKFLNKKLTKEQLIEQWINKEVQYAKRQYTFMKKDTNIHWFEV